MTNLVEGLSLMVIGMGTVFSFLSVLVFFIMLSSKIINRFWPENLVANETSKNNRESNQDEIVAVISTAVHRYRNKKQ
ncbi:OadG family protein [Pleionea sediminis]|uniref:OadG family protein n=1 Tax=Pleionea sediminis TaxID=2569479 RepID=UPI001184A680|nr:OadG family protein [Pleionea sediminis]